MMDEYSKLECYKITLFLTKLGIVAAEPVFHDISYFGDYLQQLQEDEDERNARWHEAMRMHG